MPFEPTNDSRPPLLRPQLHRRDVLRGGAVVAAGLGAAPLLAACSDDGGSGDAAPSDYPLATKENPVTQPIFDLESPHLVAGRVVLIGDAAFVARPHVATGVTKAALDATCLAEALAAEKTIDEALGRYERERAPAGRRLVARGRYLGAFLEGRDADPMRTPETIIREYGAAGVIQKPGV
jgi:hypothetical protein